MNACYYKNTLNIKRINVFLNNNLILVTALSTRAVQARAAGLGKAREMNSIFEHSTPRLFCVY